MLKQVRYLAGLVLLFGALSSFAQVAQTIRFNVPFSFVVAGKSFPPGDYKMELDTDQNFLSLISSGMSLATVMTAPDDPWLVDEGNCVLFQSDGERWILHKVLVEGRARMMILKKSERGRLERNVLRAQTERTIAGIPSSAN